MKIAVFIIILLPNLLFAQNTINNNISFNGYAEAYYSYNTASFAKATNKNENYIYNHNLVNQFAINLAVLQAKYTTVKTRANLALQVGTYPTANYAAEPITMQFINEANIGIKLSNKKNIWLDAGIMPSHIGAETAIGKDNPMLTRSLLADNSPYFETGIKTNYTSNNEKLSASILLLNGWQNIVAMVPNNPLAFGLQITYSPNSNLKINYSNYIGKVNKSGTIFNRTYHDFFAEYKFAKNYKLGFCFDFGSDELNNAKQNWNGINGYLQAKINSKHSITGRFEKFTDNNLIFLQAYSPITITNNPSIFSVNYDYAITSNAFFRLEPKYTWINKNLFKPNIIQTTSHYTLTSSLCLNF